MKKNDKIFVAIIAVVVVVCMTIIFMDDTATDAASKAARETLNKSDHKQYEYVQSYGSWAY